VSAALAVAAAPAVTGGLAALAPARIFPGRRDGVRLLAIDARARRFREHPMRELPALLAPGDLLVVNDAATLPASFRGQDGAGRAVEARLLAKVGASTFRAALLGAGDWRTRTEDRPAPPPVALWQRLTFGALGATIVGRSAISPRLVTLAFDAAGSDLWAALYRHGEPVQYAHLALELPLWAVQNVYASRPEAFEMASAGRPLSWEILLGARRRGVRLVALTHAAGLSATGDPAIDGALPLPERYDLPARTVALVGQTRRAGGRVVAVGTTVVRALEGAASSPAGLRAGPGETDLRIDPAFRPRVVDGILSGMHGPGESHFDLLGAFAPRALLDAAWAHAAAAGFKSHELGDATLILG
jgi:S-adenosylmethionine:tRNA ribosyltransferase-isomerase